MCKASPEGGAPSPLVGAVGTEAHPPRSLRSSLEGGAPSPPRLARAASAIAIVAAVVLLASVAVAGQKAPAKAKAKPQPADNSYCAVCHANMKSEPLAKKHQAVGVGCATCHGESDKHSSDENNITPPDIMYAKDQIAAACMKCHAAAKLTKPKSKVAHAPFRAAKPSTAACTSCHGAHRLPVRTRQWDKVTRKLIQDDGVRMLPEAAPRSP